MHYRIDESVMLVVCTVTICESSPIITALLFHQPILMKKGKYTPNLSVPARERLSQQGSVVLRLEVAPDGYPGVRLTSDSVSRVPFAPRRSSGAF